MFILYCWVDCVKWKVHISTTAAAPYKTEPRSTRSTQDLMPCCLAFSPSLLLPFVPYIKPRSGNKKNSKYNSALNISWIEQIFCSVFLHPDNNLEFTIYSTLFSKTFFWKLGKTSPWVMLGYVKSIHKHINL